MDKPTSIIIRCQGCKTQFTPRQLAKTEAMCGSCREPKWHVQAEFDIVEEGDAAAGTLGMNAIGIGLLAATGSGFVVTGGAGRSKNVGKSIAEVYDVDGEQMRTLCTPVKSAFNQVAEFVIKREQEVQRNRMHERGASHCSMCNILFVPSEEKPWTLLGTCSKSCCAAKHGSSSYSEVEAQVSQATKGVSSKLTEFKKDSSRIDTTCTCGHLFSVPRMYQGTYRKCPQCQFKTLVPMKS